MQHKAKGNMLHHKSKLNQVEVEKPSEFILYELVSNQMSEFAGTIATKESFHLNQTNFLALLTWKITDGAPTCVVLVLTVTTQLHLFDVNIHT